MVFYVVPVMKTFPRFARKALIAVFLCTPVYFYRDKALDPFGLCVCIFCVFCSVLFAVRSMAVNTSAVDCL